MAGRVAEPLDELLARASAADGLTRIELRDPIADHGAAAISALSAWLTDVRLGAFAVRAIARAAVLDPALTAAAVKVLAAALPRVAPVLRVDIEAALVQFRGPAAHGGRPAPAGSPAEALADLRSLLGEWQAAGRPAQPAIDWPRDRWLAEFPEHRPLLDRLPDRLDRATVRDHCTSAAADEDAARRAFIVVMAWGQGRNGYAQFRARRVFEETPDAGRRLQSAAATLAVSGAIAAYRDLADGGPCRLYGLGPAFGTKYLYFCQDPAGQPRALIFDDLVSSWLLARAGTDLPSDAWSPDRYGDYLRLVHGWAADLGCAPDEAEMLIFRAVARQRGTNQWAW